MFNLDTLHVILSGKAAELIKKHFVPILVVISLMAALLAAPASASAEDEPTREAESGFFIKPSSGLDIKPDTGERKENTILSPKLLPLSDNADMGPLFGEPQQKGISDKKHSTDHRVLLGFTFHF